MAGLLSGVLPAIYSRADALKRGLLDFAQNPVASLEQTAGGILDAAKAQEQRMGQAFANPQRPLQVTDQNALAQATQAMMAGPLGFAPAGITVWHGSPHTFSKFDASKIGTGEGAQAYGHGLYLAEAKDVADMYRKTLTQTDDFVDGQLLDSTNPRHFLARVLSDESGNIEAARESLEMFARPGASKSVAQSARQALDLLANGERPVLQTVKPDGSLYKVDLPDEAVAKMLDWDKPLSQQSDAVKKSIGLDKNPNASIKDMTGLEFYVGTGGKLGEPTSASKAAAEHLRKKGILGIRYLDGGSRGTGQGTSNFVVFPGNEGLLSILERNGKPVR